MKWEFVGILSGDMECFCWEVDAAEFKKAAGHAPATYDRMHNPRTGKPLRGSYRLYPTGLFAAYDLSNHPDRPQPRYRFRIEILAEDGSEPQKVEAAP